MTTDPFTDAASAAAEKQWPRELISGHPLSGPERMNRRIGFTMGAEWARTHLTSQELTDAEVEAAARALWAEVWIDPDEHPWDTEATGAERASCRREARAALSAARAARRDEEKRAGSDHQARA